MRYKFLIKLPQMLKHIMFNKGHKFLYIIKRTLVQIKYSTRFAQNLSNRYNVSTWSIILRPTKYFTSSWPSLAAMCRAVYRSFVVESTAAPCWRSNITMSTFPRRAAICNGVCCSYNTSINRVVRLFEVNTYN